MSWQEIVAAVLLAIGVACVLLSCIGVLAGRNAYARLHFLGPATIVGPIAIAAAVVACEGLSQAGIKAILVAVVLVVTGPVLTHATARTIYTRETCNAEEPSGEGADAQEEAT